MSSSKADPRTPDTIVPYHLPVKSHGQIEYAGNIALAIGMAGMMVRNGLKPLPWIAALFGVLSMLNTRKSKKEDSMGLSGAVLGIVSLFTFYFNLYMLNKRQLMQQENAEMGA
ncbi:hypothetical protein BX666DRAFT_1971730 [Dichotomocladium elegans]|nr:hypothetical protein BX666DRAFT_1971730 [Dichotomocladium elegans]